MLENNQPTSNLLFMFTKSKISKPHRLLIDFDYKTKIQMNIEYKVPYFVMRKDNNLLVFSFTLRALYLVFMLILVNSKGNRTLTGDRTNVTVQLTELHKLTDEVHRVGLNSR